MLGRRIGWFIFCSSLYVANAQNPVDRLPRVPVPQPPAISESNASQCRISVVRLSVPEKARKLYNNALSAFVKLKLAEAKHKLDQALNLYPTFPDALTLRGGIDLNMQHWEPAEQDLQAAIRIDPTYLPAYVGLADLYNAESRFDDALAVTEKADAFAPNWNVSYEIARALIGKEQYERALTTADDAIHATADHHPLLHLAKAHAFAGLRKYPQAAAELRSYLSDPFLAEDDPNARDMLNRIERAMSQ